MRKGKSLIGLRVVGQSDGSELGNVWDLVFDHDSDEVLALVLSESHLFGLIKTQVVPWNQVRSIGDDAVLVDSAASKIAAPDAPRINAVMERGTAFSGSRILSEDGQDLGTLADLHLDEATGRVVGYEVSGGFVSDTLRGKRFLPASSDLKLGADTALVPSGVGAQLEAQAQNQPGGLKGAMAAAAGEISGAFGAARDKASDAVSGAYANIAGAPVAGASLEKPPQSDMSQTAVEESKPAATLAPTSATAALLTPNDREVMMAVADEAVPPPADGQVEIQTTDLKPTTNPGAGLPHGPMCNEHSGGMTQTPTG